MFNVKNLTEEEKEFMFVELGIMVTEDNGETSFVRIDDNEYYCIEEKMEEEEVVEYINEMIAEECFLEKYDMWRGDIPAHITYEQPVFEF